MVEAGATAGRRGNVNVCSGDSTVLQCGVRHTLTSACIGLEWRLGKGGLAVTYLPVPWSVTFVVRVRIFDPRIDLAHRALTAKCGERHRSKPSVPARRSDTVSGIASIHVHNSIQEGATRQPHCTQVVKPDSTIQDHTYDMMAVCDLRDWRAHFQVHVGDVFRLAVAGNVHMVPGSCRAF